MSSQPSRKVTSADFAEPRQEVRQEDYPASEKLRVSKTQVIVSLVQCILGIVLCAYGFFLWSIYPFFLTKGLLFIGASVAIVALFSFISSLKDSGSLKRIERTDYWFDTSSHLPSRIVFIASVIQAGFLFVYIVTIFVSQTTVHNYITANAENTDKANRQWNSYRGYLVTSVILCIVTILVILRTTYSSFVFSNSPHFFRVALYFFTIFTLCLVGCLVYAAESTGYLNNIHSLEEVTNYFTIRLLVWLSLLIAGVLVAIILTNFTKRLSLFMSIATLLVLICVVLVSFNGSLYRDSRKINEYVEKNCQNQMQIIHEEDLKSLGCPNKYILRKEDQPYPDCERQFQAVNWESDIGKENEDKISAIECLNTKCCGLSGKIYSDWFLSIATLGKLVSVFSFVIIGMCCFLSTRFTGNPKLSQEFVYVAIAILTIIFWVLIIKQFPFEPIKEKPGLIASLPTPDKSAEIYKTYQYSRVTKRAECEKTFAEYFQIYYNQPFSKTEAFQCDGDCSNTLLRVGVTTFFYQISVSQSFNDKDLKIFDERFFPVFNDDKPMEASQNFIGAEGTVKSVRNFLASSICLTAYEPQANHNLIVSVKRFERDTEKSNQSSSNHPVYHKSHFQQHKNDSNRFKDFIFENINGIAGQSADEGTTRSGDFQTQGEENLNQMIRFQTVELIVKDAESDKEVTGKRVKVDVYFNQVECILQEIPARISLESKDSKFLLKNLESSTYTVFVKTDGYNFACKRLILTEHSKSTQQVVYLTPLLQKEEIRVVLEWSSTNFASLDLLSTVTISNKENCIVGYLNENCPQIGYERKTQRPYHQSIKIASLAATEYLIYIRQNLTLKEYKELVESGKDSMNEILAESSPHISVYVAGLEYPVQESGLSPLDPAFRTEENLVWIIACLNGSYGNIVHPINSYWTYTSAHDYIVKKNSQQIPPAEICTKYRQSLKN